MSERLIHGKPGSGKSCYCVSLLIKALADWVRFDVEKGEQYPRVLYTNIPLDVDAVNEYLRQEVGGEVDVTSHIVFLSDNFFRDGSSNYRAWWDDFPEGAMIVIDEVHHYLPANLRSERSGIELSKQFVNYVSMHRHQQQDIIFLTQHLNNIAPEVKRMAEVVYEVLNIKNTTVGIFPFKVQMADIDVVREAWGYPVQMAHIKRGVCEANTVVYDKAHEVFILTSALFKLYRSHTLSEESLDRPSLKLGKFGSVAWLVRRYFTRFFIWGVILITVFLMGKSVVESFPAILQKSLVPGSVSNLPGNPSPGPVLPGSVPPRVHSAELEKTSAIPTPQNTAGDDVILGFVRDGVITKRGVVRKDEHLTIDGNKDYVKNIDVMRGILYLGSGKKVQK